MVDMNNDVTDIEVFRKKDVGNMVCMLTYANNSSMMVPLLYHGYASLVMSNLCFELKKLENMSIIPSVCNPHISSLFIDLFACFEQFIGTVASVVYYSYKSSVIDEKNRQNLFQRGRDSGYDKTIREIFKLLGTDGLEFKKKGLLNKLQDMALIRNYLLHGNMGQVKIGCTKLPTEPLTLTCADLVEALSIFVEVAAYFRYVVPKIDLMPNICVPVGETSIYRRLDEYFDTILLPYFISILGKHNLVTNKAFEITGRIAPLNVVGKWLTQNACVIVKAKAPEMDFKPCNECTDLYGNIIRNAIRQEDIPQNGKFRLPNYSR